MSSLYSNILSNEELLRQIPLRARKINLDYLYIGQFEHDNYQIFRNITWNNVNFDRNSIGTIPNTQGIYIFCFNPYEFSKANHSGEIILYIGQAQNLRDRLLGYFNYPNSRIASDQQRRYMILFFNQFLRVKFYETINWTQADLDSIEYGLIDTIIPPFNQRFKSQLAQGFRKVLYNI